MMVSRCARATCGTASPSSGSRIRVDGTSLITNIDSVSVQDSLTAVAWFKKRTPEQFYDLVYQVVIVPEHVLGNTPAAQLQDGGRRAPRHRVGALPSRHVAARPSASSSVADTANYRGRAKLDRVVIVHAPDFNRRRPASSPATPTCSEQLRPEQIAKVAADSQRCACRALSDAQATRSWRSTWWTPRQWTRPHPIFGDRAVRRALSMAVDRRAMLRNVFDTIGTLLYGPFPHALSVADTTLPQLPYDTLKARALLDSAGWLAGPDGIRVKNGRRLEFGLSTPSSSAARHQYAVLIQEAMRRVGASVRLDETDFATWAAKQGSHAFDAEMAIFDTDPSPSGFKQSWTTAGIARDGANYPAYSNPTVDALLDSATSSFDPARTRSYARRAFEIIIDDAPAIWLYEPPTVAGLHKRIRTTTLRADGCWSDLADWYIPAGERTARDQIGLRSAQ